MMRFEINFIDGSSLEVENVKEIHSEGAALILKLQEQNVVLNTNNVLHYTFEDQTEKAPAALWLNTRNTCHCSYCMEKIKKSEMKPFFGSMLLYDFCPNCGRKMGNGGEGVPE